MTDLPEHSLVKICGLRTLEHAQVASDAGADLVGFVFAPSKRQVNADIVRPIIAALGGSAIPVGLFVSEPVETINATATAAGISLLQVHWRADERDLQALELPYLLVRRTEPDATYEEVAFDLERVLGSANPPLRFLIDAYHPGLAGGTGMLADWELAAQLARSFPVMLAGGLTPENVGDAIEQVRPVGVDVSSGVEVDGVKSSERIRAFVGNARTAFDRQSSSSESTVHS